MELNKENMKKIMFLIAFGFAFYLLIKNLYLVPSFFSSFFGAIGPILAGFAIAFVVNVLMVQVENRLFAPINRMCTKIWPKIRRSVSILVSFVIILGLITLLMFFVVPELGHTIINLTSNIPTYFTNIQNGISAFYKGHPKIAEYAKNVNINWGSISKFLSTNGQKIASQLISSTFSITSNIFHGAISAVLALVIAVNTLAQKEKLHAHVKKFLYAYLPRKHADTVSHICHLTNRAFYNCIAGTFTEACILGTLCFVGMNIFHFPYAILISVLVAFNALIPIIGSFLSTVVGGLLVSTANPIQGIWYMIYFCILQQLEGNLIYPRVVGSRVGLPVLWMMVAITIGGNFFGVLGMLINIPICSVIYTLLRENIHKREKRINCPADKPEPAPKADRH
jgi:predicted PurR-regulated permease PerM